MLSADLIRQIQHLELKANKLASATLAGEYLSAFKGTGIEFDRVREYVPGDDVRSIDWNVTARMPSPHVKIFREERELTVMLLVDVSPSQAFGSTGRFKVEAATELAAIIAFLASRNQDNIGLIMFSDHIEQFIPPQKGRAHIWQIIRAILTHEQRGEKTDIAQALSYLLEVCKKRAMVFLVSDFVGPTSWEKLLGQVAKRHELIAVALRDQREQTLPDVGLIECIDSESGLQMTLDTHSRSFREAYYKHQQQDWQRLQTIWRRHRVDNFVVTTQESTVQPLAQFIRKREKRGAVR